MTDDDLLRLSEVDQLSSNRQILRFQATATWGRRVVRDHKQFASKSSAIRSRLPKSLSNNQSHAFSVSPTPYAPGLSTTFVGHSILPALGLHASHFFIDRGAYQFVNNRDRHCALALLDAKKTLSWLDENIPREKHHHGDKTTGPRKTEQKSAR